MDQRQLILQQWLQTDCHLPAFTVHMLPGDASFRRYFRVFANNTAYIAMDAPPHLENNCRPFIAIATGMRQHGLHTPEILAQNISQGFLLLTDFGDQLYLHTLHTSNAARLYAHALDALAQLQAVNISDWPIPLFTAELMQQELQLCQEWFLQKHLQLQIDDDTQNMLTHFFHLLTHSASTQPYVFMHRDYHSANLILLPKDEVGILDFQDAFMGPVTYDLVSLLRDCYIDWPDTLVEESVCYYKNKLDFLNGVSHAQFLRWFDLMGLQRHLKALLTFARKFHRDSNAAYLRFIPRTVNYLAKIAALYPETAAFNEFIHTAILPRIMTESGTCVQ